jgi:hypothetical protein
MGWEELEEGCWLACESNLMGFEASMMIEEAAVGSWVSPASSATRALSIFL